MIGPECVGAIVCKLDLNRKSAKRGYIAMLAVDGNHRNKGIGKSAIVVKFWKISRTIQSMYATIFCRIQFGSQSNWCNGGS